VCKYCKNGKGRRGYHLVDPTGDLFAETVLDYAYNLAASGALVIPDHVRTYENSRSLVRKLVGQNLTLAKQRALASKRNIDEIVAEALESLLRRSKRKIRKPSTPRAPAAFNLQVIASTLGLDVVEAAVLQFAVAATRQDMQDLLDPISCVGLRSPAIVIAAATGLIREEVYAALDRKGHLVMSGLIELNDHGDLDDRVQADRRTGGHRLLAGTSTRLHSSTVSCLRPRSPPLVVEDFAHLKGELAMARKLLGAALDVRKPGVNVLVHGPTGTGKSEAGTAAQWRDSVCLLMVAGREDSVGRVADCAGAAAVAFARQQVAVAKSYAVAVRRARGSFHAESICNHGPNEEDRRWAQAAHDVQAVVQSAARNQSCPDHLDLESGQRD
jgi:hypothetical protein